MNRLVKYSEVGEVVESWCDEGILLAPLGVTFEVEAERPEGRATAWRWSSGRGRLAGLRMVGRRRRRRNAEVAAYWLVPAAEDEDGLGGTVSYWCGAKAGEEGVLVWGESRPHHIGRRGREGVDLVRKVVGNAVARVGGACARRAGLVRRAGLRVEAGRPARVDAGCCWATSRTDPLATLKTDP